MKKCFSIAALFFTFSLFSQAQAETVSLRLHTHLPPRALAQVEVITPWIKKIEQESEGKIKVQVFPALQLGGTPAQLMDQVKDGVVDMTWVNIGYTPGRYPASEVFELPFMIKSSEGASQALWQYYEANDLASTEYKDWHIIGLNVHDAGQIHMRKTPIQNATDFQGKKIRAPSRVTTKLIESLGATAIGMPINQVGEALSRGLIDGAILPWEIVPAIRAHEMVNFHTETNPNDKALYTSVFAFAMNKETYAKLAPELKKVIDANSGMVYAQLAGQAWDNSVSRARQLALERGNKFNMIKQEEIEKWQGIAQQVNEDWIRDIDQKGLDAQALLSSANELLLQYDNQ